MKTIKCNGVLTPEERETIIVYDNQNDLWEATTTIPKHYRRLMKMEWTPTVQYIYEDGSVCGMVLTAPARAITFRNPNKKRTMTEKQLQNLHGRVVDEDEDEDEE